MKHKFNPMKTIAIPILAVVLCFNLSCQKEQDITKTKTIDVTVASGESYSTTVSPKGDDDFSITLQAAHASLSELATANGNMIFTYTPANGYIGNDEVQITASQENQHGHGNCPSHHQNDESTVYVYKITVTGETH